MKAQICLENAYFTCQFTDNYQKHSDIQDIVTKVKTILYQRTDRAIVMHIKIVMMMLSDSQ